MNTKAKVAYFCMEYGIEYLPFCGGLGILAGDYLKSCSDLGFPVVGIGLLYSQGSFHQKLSKDGWQTEWFESFDPTGIMKLHPKSLTPDPVIVQIEGRSISLNSWQYDITSSIPGEKNFVPLLYLDTKGNHRDRPWDDNICNTLYPSIHPYHRLTQEQVLGTGGVRMLDKLGFKNIEKYHLNEGHAALSILELKKKYHSWAEAAKHTVYTTHTPVPAGIDSFERELAEQVLGNDIPSKEEMLQLTGSENLNMMRLATSFSSQAFGVSPLHAQVSKELFSDYPNINKLYSIDNGIHLPTWTSPAVQKLYDKLTDGGWRINPHSIERILEISEEEVLNVHSESRERLGEFFQNNPSVKGNSTYDPEKLTIGFARRFATYKQAKLIFDQIDRLRKIGKDIQLVFAGKAHPSDEPGKKVIMDAFGYMKELEGEVSIWFIEDYDMKKAKYMVRGVDLWLNNPIRLQEASGTSGMKAAANFVPQLSVIDGWWYPQDPTGDYTLPHGLIEGVTGWGIGRMPSKADFCLLHNNIDELAVRREDDRKENAEDLITKLEDVIVPLFKDKKSWARVMRAAAAHNAPWFNTHRMAKEYFEKAYCIPIDK